MAVGRIFRAKRASGAIKLIVYIVVVIGIVVLMILGIGRLGQTQSAEQLRVAEDAIVKAAVQCYALESRFPPGLDYLEANYGLVLDRDKYIYHYQAIGSNMLPQIRVLLKPDSAKSTVADAAAGTLSGAGAAMDADSDAASGAAAPENGGSEG